MKGSTEAEANGARARDVGSLAAMVDHLPGMAYRCRFDRHWTMLFMSRGAEDVTGYSRDDLLHNRRISFGDLIHRDDRLRIEHEVRAAALCDEPYQLNYRIIAAAGDTKWLREQGNAIRDAHGDIVELVGFITDVTAQVHAEAAVERTETRFRSIYQLVPVAVWEEDWDGVHALLGSACDADDLRTRLDADPEFVESAFAKVSIIDANEFTATLLGAPVDDTTEALRRTLSTPQGLSVFKHRLLAYVEGRPDFEAELTLPHPGGHIHVLMRGAFGTSDTARSALVTLTDITTRRHAEDVVLRIAQSVSIPIGDEFFHHLTERVIQALDATGGTIGLLDANDTDTVETQTLILRGERFAPARYAIEGAPCEAVLAGQSVVFRSRLHERFPADEPLRHFGIEAYAGAPMWSQAGEVMGLVSVFYDHPIDAVEAELILSTLRIFAARAAAELERQAADRRIREQEERIRQSQRLEAVGQLTGGLAHDFNNLLTVIMGNADLLTEQLQANPQLHDFAQMIGTAAQRGAELTQRLLAFARRQVLAPTTIDVNQLVAGMDGLLRRTLGGHIEIELVNRVGLWPAIVDPAQLENALLNLCLNARDAMPGGGRLTIETDNVHFDPTAALHHGDVEPGDYVMLAVSDTGVGIAAEHRDRVFEPFYTTKAKGKGTGLGLSMVYGFIKQSRGTVKLTSEPGQGTTIRLYLPRSEYAQAVPANASPAAAEPGSETVLLVEDDALVRHFAHEQLTQLGYRVLTADSGPRALEILEHRDDIDLLFTDIVMPGGMNGRDLADAAAQLRPRLKVLYTSGYAESAMGEQGRLPPDLQLLGKPYGRAELASKLREVLDPR